MKAAAECLRVEDNPVVGVVAMCGGEGSCWHQGCGVDGGKKRISSLQTTAPYRWLGFGGLRPRNGIPCLLQYVFDKIMGISLPKADNGDSSGSQQGVIA